MRSLPPVRVGGLGRMGIHQQRFSVSSMSPTLWLDAADPLSIIEESGRVSQWRDKSGNGNHALQESTSQQPLTGTHTINNKNAIFFDGISNNFTLDPIKLSGSDELTILFAARLETVPDSISRAYFGFGGNSVYRAYCNAGNDDLSLAYKHHSVDLMKYSGLTTDSLNTPQILGVIGRKAKAAGVICGDIGLLFNENAASDNAIGFTDAAVGAINTSGYGAINASIGEFLVFKRALSNFELNNVGTYLSKKWGAQFHQIGSAEL